MNDIAREIRRLGAEGYCCSQIMVKMGLDAQDDDNPELLDAVAGLCGGLYSGLCCGTLTGAACLLSLYDKERGRFMIPQLVRWFSETWTSRYGGVDCEKIIDGNEVNRVERCPVIMVETFQKCRELLRECEYEV